MAVSKSQPSLASIRIGLSVNFLITDIISLSLSVPNLTFNILYSLASSTFCANSSKSPIAIVKDVGVLILPL
jgi:hypothetical protein